MRKNKKILMSILLILVFGISFSFAGCKEKDPYIPDDSKIPLPSTVTQEELLNKMKSSVYSDFITTQTAYGLKEAQNVGVNQQEFEKVLYPLPADSEFAQIYNVNDYNVLPENNDNTKAFNALVTQAKAIDGKVKFYFPQGIYKFSETISIKDQSDWYFAGDKAEWLMNEWTTILNLENCVNFHINGIDFDYKISPTVAGKVVSTDSTLRTVGILIDDEFDMTNYRYNGGKVNFGNYMEYYYDAENQAYVPDVNGMLRYNSTGDSVKSLMNGVYDTATKILTLELNTTQGAFNAPAVDTMVSVGYTMYEYTGFYIKGCQDFYMENCNIYTTPGMAITCYSDKNLYFNRTNIMLRPGSKRLMTATADGLHTIDCYGDLIVTNSIYEASHDDAMNICTFYFKIDEFFRNTLKCTATTTEVRIPINAGDTIEIYDKDTMQLLYTRQVLEANAYGITFELVLDKNIPTAINISNYLVANATRVPRLKVSNCIIRNKRNRGILAQVQDSEISNCSFVNVVHGPLMIHSAQDVFSEAIVPRDIVIKNCKFLYNNSARGLNGDVAAFRHGGTLAAGTITGIKVENNFFYKSSYSGVYLCATGESEIKNNLFYDICTRTTPDSAYHTAASIYRSSGTNVQDNYVYMTQSLSGVKTVNNWEDINTVQSGNSGHNI